MLGGRSTTEFPEKERTIVDAAYEWLDAQAAEHPELLSVLSIGAEAAARVVPLWHSAWLRRIAAVRRSEALLVDVGTSRAHRAGGELLRALVTRHDTCRVFLSEPTDGLQRWQMWSIVLTLVLTQLLVNIWMFWAKGVNCCQELRATTASACSAAAIECPADTATCADLLTAIAAPDSSYPPALADWTCTSFPNDDLPGDSLIVALIAMAVSLPVTIFLAGCFEIANDSDAPESWLRYAGTTRILCGRQAHRRWHYTGPAGQPMRFVKWYVRCSEAPTAETMMNALHSIRAAVTGKPPPWASPPQAATEPSCDDAELMQRISVQTSIRLLMGEQDQDSAEAKLMAATLDDCRTATQSRRVSQDTVLTWIMYSHAIDDAGSEQEELSPEEEARELRREKRQLTAIGLGGVLVVWVVMAYFIFTYGLLILQLLGLDAQRSFTRSWGVSYGVGAASEWRDVLRQAVTSILVLAIAERLHLTRPVAWLEDHIDYISTSALLLEHGGLSFFQELRLFFTFRGRLTD